MFLAGGGEAVEFELALQILTGRLPLCGDPAFPLQAMQCGIERPMFHLQDVVGAALDVLGDLVAMSGTKNQGAQDQHVEGALQQVNSFFRFFRHSAGRYSTQKLV